MSKHYVYLLECKGNDNEKTIYCGYTSRTPNARLKDHLRNVRTKKKKHYTGRQKFVRLVYHEKYEDRKTALKREKEIKKRGTKYKLGLIDGMKNISRNKS